MATTQRETMQPECRYDGSFRVRTDHLRVYLTIYAVFFTIGTRDAIDLAWKCNTFGIWLGTVSLSLIGLRLLFAPDAFNQVLAKYQESHPAATRYPRYFVVSYPFLIAQAACVYLAMHNLSDVDLTGYSHADLPQVIPTIKINPWAVKIALVAMLLNTVWLACIQCTACLTCRGVQHKQELFSEGYVWIWIGGNAIVLALAVAGLYQSVYPSIHEEIALAILLVGSVLDLSVTGSWYLDKSIRQTA